MANKTDQQALHKHGTDPQHLLPAITRAAIYSSIYWNQSCFGLTVADLVHVAVHVRYVAGLDATRRPAPFLCLLLKLLQLSPDLRQISIYLQQSHFKYPRILAAFYVRLVESPPNVYKSLEPLLSDCRRIVTAHDHQIETPENLAPSSHPSDLPTSSSFTCCYVDMVIDALLRSNMLFGIPLPRIPPRPLLVQTDQLAPRVSSLSI